MSFNQDLSDSGLMIAAPLRLAGRGCLAAVAAALLALVCGCGEPKEERPPLHPTQGSLWINGQPAAGAMLVLHHTGDALFDARGTRPTATVDAAGDFELTTYQAGDGAPAGEYQVAILWFDDLDASSPWDKLGGRFADPARTSIRLTVGPEQTKHEPIRIDAVQILPRRPSGNFQDLDQVE